MKYLKRLIQKYLYRELWLEAQRNRLNKMSEKDIKTAQMMLTGEPLKTYLIALMDNVIRNSLHLTAEKQIGAKQLVEMLLEEILIGENESLKRLKTKTENKKDTSE